MRPLNILAHKLKAKGRSKGYFQKVKNKSMIWHLTPFKICIISLTLSYIPSMAQINVDGVPFIKNYDPKTYNAADFNYSITQDNRGIIYIGNSENIIEYDGQSWNKINIPVISLVKGKNNTIYVGTTNDFGHLTINSCGKLIYESLSPLVQDSTNISRIWKTYASGSKIYFCTLEQIFIYNTEKNTVKNIKIPFENNFFSFLLNNQLYTSNYEKGLLLYKDNKYQIAPGGNYYAKKDIFSMLNYTNNTIIISTYEGLTLYNSQTGESKSFNTINAKTNSIFNKTPIYTGVKINEDQFAYGTIGAGLFVINKAGEIITQINKNSGLQYEEISQIFLPEDNSGIAWLTLGKGFTSVNLHSPVRKFAPQQGLEEIINDINQFENQLYFASSSGVSQMIIEKGKQNTFHPIKSISGEITTSLINFHAENNKVVQLAGTVKDIYQVSGQKAKPLNINTETYSLLQSKVIPNTLYAGTSRGIKVIKYKNGRFVSNEDYIGLPKQQISLMEEDRNGNIWSNTISGRQLIDKEGKLQELPEPIKSQDGAFYKLQNDILYVTNKQAFILDSTTKVFKEHKWLTNKYLNLNKTIKKLIPLNNNKALLHFTQDHKPASDLLYYEQGEWYADTLSLRILPSMTINNAFCDQHKVYIGGSEGLFVANLNREKDFQNPFQSLIHTVTISNDSIYYKRGTGSYRELEGNNRTKITAPQEIAYKYNNISFTYLAPFFEHEEEVKHRSYLEGYDNQWSLWTNKNERTYTNLGEGDYKFHVEAKNLYNQTSSIETFEFTIAPPWYRTWWAYSVYLIIGFVIIRISIVLYTRKLQEDKKRLEKIVKERTAEIFEKNKRIEKQNLSITDSIRYAQRIQTAVLPNKQTSEMFEYFIYFKPKDIVSGDFYWVYHFEKDQQLIVVAADCTGHGVPGAFMSMLGTSFLNEIVAKPDMNHSDIILNQLRENVIKTLNQGSKEEQKDGMDMAIASINLKTKVLEYSGANNPLILIRNNELIEYKPDKMPIGLYVKQGIPFTRHEIQLQKNDIFYLFSDGYVDQFGGKQGRKYMKKRFKEFLLSIHQHPIEKQKEMLNEEMFNWMDGTEQIDDQIIIGMRLVK